MIPSLLLFGLITGRWWRSSLGLAALGWPSLLVATEVMGLSWGLFAAAGVAVANTAVGVLVHQALLWGVRALRRSEGDHAIFTRRHL